MRAIDFHSPSCESFQKIVYNLFFANDPAVQPWRGGDGCLAQLVERRPYKA